MMTGIRNGLIRGAILSQIEWTDKYTTTRIINRKPAITLLRIRFSSNLFRLFQRIGLDAEFWIGQVA